MSEAWDGHFETEAMDFSKMSVQKAESSVVIQIAGTDNAKTLIKQMLRTGEITILDADGKRLLAY